MARRRLATLTETPPGGRTGLVVFSPLPPMPTGIADYTAALLPALAQHYDVTVVVEDTAPPVATIDGVEAIRLTAFLARPPIPHAVNLYMIGNNPDHVYLLPVLAARPGVAVLHDPALHHLLDLATLTLGDFTGYRAALEADYGPLGRLFADHWRDHALREEAQLLAMPMLRHVLGPARHVLVHSRYAAAKVLAETRGVPVTIAPHPFAPHLPKPRGSAFRRRFAIPSGALVFLSLGFVTHTKRIDTTLRALARIADRLGVFRYVIAGALNPKETDVAAIAAALGLTDQVIATDYLEEADLSAAIDAADVVINLRHPAAGETSGTLIRALGGGACTVVTDNGSFAELPDGIVRKVSWGQGVEQELAETLLDLAAHPPARRRLGAAAASHIAARHAPHRTLAAYRAAIDAAAVAPDRPWRRTAAFTHAPPQRAIVVNDPLWRRLDAMPGLQLPGAVLASGTAEDLRGLRALGHDPVVADADWAPEQAGPRAYDIVFLHLRAGHPLLTRPDLGLALNAIVRFGGALVLALSGVPAHAHDLAARDRGAATLVAAGFRVDLAEGAAPAGLLANPPEAPDGMVWRAIKLNEPFQPWNAA